MPEEPRPGVDVAPPVVAPPQPDLEEELGLEEELWTDDSGEDYSGWHCVRTDPWPCPAEAAASWRTSSPPPT